MYQQIRLSDTSLVGAPGPLPYAVAGWTDDLLRDLSQLDLSFGLAGMAFWPVVVTTPAFDPARQVAVPPANYAADPSTYTVTGAATVRDMTAAEYAAANPPRTVAGVNLVAALTDEQAASVKLRDLLRVAGQDAVPITKGAVKRIADKIGITPAALFDAAEGN